MSAIITNQFRKNSRELFINDIDTNTNYFIGIGKSEPWPDVGGVEESALNYSVPLPTNTIIEKTDVLKNLISLLKVQSTFTVIPRDEWVSGRVYKVYDPSDPNIFNYETIGNTAYYPCYMTHNDHVFVCLRNGNNGPSTENVTIETYEDPNTSNNDGYAWAYVCDLTTTSAFYTDQFVDIPADITDSNDISNALDYGGLVYGFKVINGGDGTSTTPPDDITLIGKDSAGNIIVDDPIRVAGTDDGPFSVTIDTNGVITAIDITQNWPTGYLEASVVVNGIETDIIPLVTPINGFGFSPRSDLPSFYAGLFAAYEGGADGEAPVGIGFRQVSLVKDATRTDNDLPPPNDTLNIYDTLQYLEVTDASGIPIDAGTVIAHTTNKAKAYLDYVDVNSTPNRIYFHQNSSGEVNQKPFETGDVTFISPGGTTTSTLNVSAIVQGEYNQGSGETLFLENRKAILRNDNQQEDIKLVIQF